MKKKPKPTEIRHENGNENEKKNNCRYGWGPYELVVVAFFQLEKLVFLLLLFRSKYFPFQDYGRIQREIHVLPV